MSNDHGNVEQAGQELITVQITPEALVAALAAVQAGYKRVEGMAAPGAQKMRQWLLLAEAAMAKAGREYSERQRAGQQG